MINISIAFTVGVVLGLVGIGFVSVRTYDKGYNNGKREAEIKAEVKLNHTIKTLRRRKKPSRF